MGPETVLLKCDIKIAFNERKRKQILDVLFSTASLQPLWRVAHWAYKAESTMLVLQDGQYCATVMSQQGVKQGDCRVTAFLSINAPDLSAVHS
jgi:hypothetical protein